MAIGCERVQTVHRRQDACPDWDLLASKAVRITAAIPLFMMGANDRHHGVWEIDPLKDLGADHRMNLHLFKLFRRQLAGL